MDPDLLLNPGPLGVQIVIPAPGRYFRYAGGHIVYRNNPDNPIEVQERLERLERARLQQIQMLQEAFADGKGGGLAGLASTGIPGDKRELLNGLMAAWAAQGGQAGAKNGPVPDSSWIKKHANQMSVYDIYSRGLERGPAARDPLIQGLPGTGASNSKGAAYL